MITRKGNGFSNSSGFGLLFEHFDNAEIFLRCIFYIELSMDTFVLLKREFEPQRP